MPDLSTGSSRGPRLAKGPVLFVCVENGRRSQMAKAFAKKHGMNAQSAGAIPSTRAVYTFSFFSRRPTAE